MRHAAPTRKYAAVTSLHERGPAHEAGYDAWMTGAAFAVPPTSNGKQATAGAVISASSCGIPHAGCHVSAASSSRANRTAHRCGHICGAVAGAAVILQRLYQHCKLRTHTPCVLVVGSCVGMHIRLLNFDARSWEQVKLPHIQHFTPPSLSICAPSTCSTLCSHNSAGMCCHLCLYRSGAWVVFTHVYTYTYTYIYMCLCMYPRTPLEPTPAVQVGSALLVAAG